MKILLWEFNKISVVLVFFMDKILKKENEYPCKLMKVIKKILLCCKLFFTRKKHAVFWIYLETVF